MFVHEPKDQSLNIRALVLWNDSDLAAEAIQRLRLIEQRVPLVRFVISEAETPKALETDAELLEQAQATHLLFLALKLGELPLPLIRPWLEQWAHRRDQSNGALAVLRNPSHIAPQELGRLTSACPGEDLPESSEEREYHAYLKQLAEKSGVEFMWGAVESDLEEATQEYRIVPPCSGEG